MSSLLIKGVDGAFHPTEQLVGLSAYDIAVLNGFVGDETAWLESLRGVGDVVQVNQGGTGATTAAQARTNLDAASNTHTHTAASVGASATNHTHTLAALGAAATAHNHTVAQVSGTTPVSKGGTGVTALAANSVVVTGVDGAVTTKALSDFDARDSGYNVKYTHTPNMDELVTAGTYFVAEATNAPEDINNVHTHGFVEVFVFNATEGFTPFGYNNSPCILQRWTWFNTGIVATRTRYVNSYNQYVWSDWNVAVPMRYSSGGGNAVKNGTVLIVG